MRFLLSVSAVLAGIGATVAAAQDVVVPNALENIEGNDANCIPLQGCFGADRFQQVFGKAQFGDLEGPRYVTHVRFRPDGVLFPWSIPFRGVTFSDVEISLSTPTAIGPNGSTVVGPDNLFGHFNLNVGFDEVVVYRGPLSLSSSFTRTAGPFSPFEFDIEIELQLPFRYDPDEGHLLLEWRNYGGDGFAFPGFADAQFAFFDPISRVTSINRPGKPEATSGIPETRGLVGEFGFVTADQVTVTNAPTRVGTSSGVNLSHLFKSSGNVTVAGLSSLDFCVGKDPRWRMLGSGKKAKWQYQNSHLNVPDLSYTGTCGDLSDITLRIDKSYRAFWGCLAGVGDDDCGTYKGPEAAGASSAWGYWIVVAPNPSTAVFTGPVAVTHDPAELIQYAAGAEPKCDAPLDSRVVELGGALAGAPFFEFPNVEGNEAVPLTAQCNGPAGLTRRTVHLYPFRVDSKGNPENVHRQSQLNGLEQTIFEASSCATGATLAQMSSLLNGVRPLLAKKRWKDAILKLEEIARVAKNAPGAFASCPAEANYLGAFIGRPLILAFTVFDRDLHAGAYKLYRIPADLGVPELQTRPAGSDPDWTP